MFDGFDLVEFQINRRLSAKHRDDHADAFALRVQLVHRAKEAHEGAVRDLDRIAGLDAGADDYLTKPFAMKELLARVRSMTRRRTEYSARELTYEDIVLNAESFELSAKNSVRLSIKEFELMQALILNAGRDLDTKYLLDHVWSSEPDAQPDTVWLYISYLRGKLRSIDSRIIIVGLKNGSYRLAPREEDFTK